MALSINTNVSALDSAGRLAKTQQQLQLTLARLSTGLRINRGADDPAGLTISERMRAQVSGLNQAVRGLEDATSMTQVADASLGEISTLIQRQRDLALQAGNDAVLDPSQRAALDTQMKQLGESIDRLASGTSFAGSKLLDGTYRDRSIQTGITADQKVDLTIASNATGTQAGFDQAGLGLSGISVTSTDGAAAALDRLDTALAEVTRQRGELGAFQKNTVETGMRSLMTASQNLTSSESLIRDTDFAQETAFFARNQILSQSGMAMLAHSNQLPSSVLRLLGG